MSGLYWRSHLIYLDIYTRSRNLHVLAFSLHPHSGFTSHCIGLLRILVNINSFAKYPVEILLIGAVANYETSQNILTVMLDLKVPDLPLWTSSKCEFFQLQ